MDAIQNRKAHNLEKPIPGCLGRMVNLFDLGAGVAGNRMLTEKAHRDEFSLSRRQLDVARTLNPIQDQIEDKLMVSELRRNSSNTKLNGTPMKMLIAQEMSKEVESKHNSPNVVAKLMGLEALPLKQPDSAAQRSCSKGYSQNIQTHSEMPQGCWKQEHNFFDKQRHSEFHHCEEQNEYKDIYEIWQQSKSPNFVRDKSPCRDSSENTNEKKMALVRQKFIEAKRLSTDDKLRQSKEFQDALEVLNSNKELFLKFLQEPNSLFSQHLCEMRSIPSPPQTNRITILRPSKMVDDEKVAGLGKKSEKQMKKQVQKGQANGWDKNNPGFSPNFVDRKGDGNPTQQTRIVVLKPSPGKIHDVKAMASPPSSSPRILRGGDFYREAENDEVQESREVAMENTCQMHENPSGHHRDETLLSSVFSNGYAGCESSFSKSENQYEVRNLSDSEVMSPSSRHSWEYINRFGSPYSSSSFSRTSYSPESSVCREAKKRLSERWAMMALNGSSQDQKHVRRSSSSLGEMLALSDAKKPARSDEEGSSKEQELRESSTCLTSYLKDDSSPRYLPRSKSVPVSSTVYDAGFTVEVSDSEVGKGHVSKDLIKTKSGKSSLKGKVSSLFFSRKKSSKEKSCKSKEESQPATGETLGVPVHSPGNCSSDVSQCVNHNGLDESLSPGIHGSVCKASSPNLFGMGSRHCIISQEAVLSVSKPVTKTQDQPSPISVLEPPFEEDGVASEPSGNIKQAQWGIQGPLHPISSNLIDKSPPIGSIARTLSWDKYSTQTASACPLKPTSAAPRAEEEQDWLFLVQKLLSTAGLDSVAPISFFARWHSPESPLDPSLREKYARHEDKEPLHEAKRRQWRSNRKLVFDCVNAALVELTGYAGMEGGARARSCNGGGFGGTSRAVMADCVWGCIKEWCSGEVRCVVEEGGGDGNSLVVERVVRKEVVGRGWVERMGIELDKVGQEIEGKLLEELLEEAAVELTLDR
ncbi:uncharacterized protein LOC131155571 [Malania oleifera]|uniref:uncharacterized protein LOC131155571 n=1 Tax=Malania oleifera TaxID=397392 RepID=UPI0025AD9DEC|nr:uncharacterized protein LOC131155571 [Malania oleifera]